METLFLLASKPPKTTETGYHVAEEKLISKISKKDFRSSAKQLSSHFMATTVVN
jgi:hypothetical protein